MDRVIIIIAVLISMIASGVDKLIGGIVGFVVTTGILLYGLSVYAQLGYCMTFGSIELPLPVFLLLILFFYGHDVSQIAVACKARAGLRKISDRLHAGKTPREIWQGLVDEFPFTEEIHRDIAHQVFEGRTFQDTVSSLIQLGIDQPTAVLRYRQTLDVMTELRELVQASVGAVEDGETELNEDDLPAVKVTSASGFFSPLNVDDLLFSYEGRLITSVAELEKEVATTNDAQQVRVGLLRSAVNAGGETVWSTKETLISGGPLAADVADTMEHGRVRDMINEAPAFTATQSVKPFSTPPRQIPSESDVLTFRCPICKMRLKCRAHQANRLAKCPGCQSRMRIPDNLNRRASDSALV